MRAFCSVIIVDCSSSDKLSISDKSSYGESRPASYLSESSSLLGNGSKRYLIKMVEQKNGMNLFGHCSQHLTSLIFASIQA